MTGRENLVLCILFVNVASKWCHSACCFFYFDSNKQHKTRNTVCMKIQLLHTT